MRVRGMLCHTSRQRYRALFDSFDEPPIDDERGDDLWDEDDLDGDSDADSDADSGFDADDDDDAPLGATHVFFENEPLIRALNDPGRSENDPEAAQRLFRGLLEATLIALIPEDTELEIDDEGQLSGDVQLGFLTVRHDTIQGDIIPMFTDEGALSEFTSEGGRYVALAVRDLFPRLLQAGCHQMS